MKGKGLLLIRKRDAVPVTKIKEQQYTMNEAASKIIEALFATFVQTTIHET